MGNGVAQIPTEQLEKSGRHLPTQPFSSLLAERVGATSRARYIQVSGFESPGFSLLKVWPWPSEYQLNYGRATWTIRVHSLVTADLLITWATSNQVKHEEMHSHVGNLASIRGSLKILIIQDSCLNMFHPERYKTQISDQRTSNHHNTDYNKANCSTNFEPRVNP